MPVTIAQTETVYKRGNATYPDARKQDNFEPASYHTVPLEFYKEHQATFGVNELIDIAAIPSQATKSLKLYIDSRNKRL